MAAFTLKVELHIAMNIVSCGSEKSYLVTIEQLIFVFSVVLEIVIPISNNLSK
jgi:hypothetical protein